MTFDFRPPPPPRLTVRVEALRVTFPEYRFAILDYGRITEPPSVEVRRRDDTGQAAHWLLISCDTNKIRRELATAER